MSTPTSTLIPKENMAKSKEPAEIVSQNTNGPTGLSPAPDYIQDSKEGLDKLRPQDIAWPRATLIQKTSKILEDRTTNVRFGDAINDLTGQKLCDPDSELDVIPVYHFLSWIEWAPLNEGGGVVRASIDPKSPVAMDCLVGKNNAEGKPLVTEYHNFLALLPSVLDSSGNPTLVLIPMKTTSHKTGKKWLMLAKMRNKALFAGQYVLSVKIVNKGDKGWVEWTVDNSTVNNGWATKELYDLGKKCYDEAKEATSRLDAALLAASEADASRGGSDTSHDDKPF